MTTGSEHDVPDFLWDPAAPAEDEVSRIERALAPLRFDPAAAPLSLEPGRPGRARWVVRTAAGAAAALVLVAGAAAFRWGWPDGEPWAMTLVAAGASRETRLEVGRPLQTGPAEAARLQVARIGTMDVSAGTDLTLRATASNRHRLVLREGMVRARVWAPPGALVIKTPAGDVIDLGCVFRLRVDPSGVARLSVESGWVQLDNVLGEALVPAGASSEMAPGAAPLAPTFDDAAPAFREGVRRLERTLAAGASPPVSLAFVEGARTRDAITLITLARNAPPAVRRRLLDRAGALVPPPSGVSVEDVVGGDVEQLWRWHDALGLPPPKSWWRNWRDALVWPR